MPLGFDWAPGDIVVTEDLLSHVLCCPGAWDFTAWVMAYYDDRLEGGRLNYALWRREKGQRSRLWDAAR